MKNELSKSSLERLLKLDDQEINRLERKGVEMGKSNTPSTSSTSLSKNEWDHLVSQKYKASILILFG